MHGMYACILPKLCPTGYVRRVHVRAQVSRSKLLGAVLAMASGIGSSMCLPGGRLCGGQPHCKRRAVTRWCRS